MIKKLATTLFLAFIFSSATPQNVLLKSTKETKKKVSQAPKVRRLRYLFFANGGMVGYYSDGTVVGCPRCDFNASNVKAMLHEKPYARYTIEPGGVLVIKSNQKETPAPENGWALINYKWYIKPPID